MSLNIGDRLALLLNGPFIVSAVSPTGATVIPFVQTPPPISANPPLHVFNAQGVPLVDSFSGIVFQADFQAVDDSGEKDCYEFCWVVSDVRHGYFLIAQFQQNSDGTHQTVSKLFKNGGLIQSNTTKVVKDLIGNPSPVKAWGAGDTLQFFLNKDRTLQFFWYRNGPIVFGQNDSVPVDFTTTDEVFVPMPMETASKVTFTGLKSVCQMGQIFNDALTHVPTIHANTSPFAVKQAVNGSNATYVYKSDHAGIEGIDYLIQS